MRTTIDIPDEELKDVMRFTGALNELEAVNVAIAEFNRRQRVEEVIQQFGSFPDFPTNEEIELAQLGEEAARRDGLG